MNRRKAAAIERERRIRRRRLRIALSAVLAVVLIGLIIYAKTGGDKTTVATATTSTIASTSTTAAAASVAGQPCVALADPLPSGAPNVPVQVGPPPTSLV